MVRKAYVAILATKSQWGPNLLGHRCGVLGNIGPQSFLVRTSLRLVRTVKTSGLYSPNTALGTRLVSKMYVFFALLLVRPSAPNNFRIIRPVNHDAMLLGWTLPKMDEFGRSRGLTVKGYKACVFI